MGLNLSRRIMVAVSKNKWMKKVFREKNKKIHDRNCFCKLSREVFNAALSGGVL